MNKPRVLILRAAGTTGDEETLFACHQAGAMPERVHINRLREQPALLQRYQLLIVPGGFSYGDDASAGRVLANQLSRFVGDALGGFRDREKLILGIGNGFQALLKAGLLLPPDEDGPLATLAHNSSGKFENRWVHLQATPAHCPFLTGMERLLLPVGHGEGRFVCREDWILKGLHQAGQVVLRYVDAEGHRGGFPINPNGSQGDVAGLCDASGRVLGLMPHPERHILPTHHPHWTRRGLAPEGDGLPIFRNAVRFFL